MLTKKQNWFYWRLWAAAARGKDWSGPQANMERHAAHVRALGRDKSHSMFTNAEFDKVKAEFELLADPTNLQAAIESADATIGERRRLVAGIEARVDESYLRPILESEHQYAGHGPWRDLPIGLLRNLHKTVVERARGRDEREGAADLDAESMERCPF